MAVAIFKTHGTVKFIQEGTECRITYSLHDLDPKRKHGFHIHQKSFKKSCSEAGSHYNPKGKEHGGLDSDQRHDGDLGNIETDVNGISYGDMYVELNLEDIIEKTIVLHAKEDDLGVNNTKESKTTGNAGARIDCAIIKRKGGLELKY